jgi:riboflavin kinase/FMN adenylyltransferase
MEIVEGWSNVPRSCTGGAIAIGNFDGVHRGHQAVLEAARTAGLALGAPVGAMMFEPHPRKFFQPDRPLFRLTSLPQKLAILRGLRLDFAAVVPFNAALSSMTAEEFVDLILVESFAVRHVAIGFDFFFGRGRDGNPAVLQELGARHGFDVSVIEPKGDAGEIFSSTRIRELLAEGDVAGAADMLGRWWSVSGPVKSGAGRGTGLGFPTANIELAAEQALRHGIYAVRIHVGERAFSGAAYLGTRPTFDAGPPVLETFLFDFDGDLYGETIEVVFVAFIRADAKFRSPEALTAQMQLDCERAQQILALKAADLVLRAGGTGRASCG